jgi:hypothetical protein
MWLGGTVHCWGEAWAERIVRALVARREPLPWPKWERTPRLLAIARKQLSTLTREPQELEALLEVMLQSAEKRYNMRRRV